MIWKHFFAPEFALITLDLMRWENPCEADPQLNTELKEILDRQNALYRTWLFIDQWEGSEKWTTLQSKFREEYREILEDSMKLFSDERAPMMLSSLEDFDVHFIVIARFKLFRDWLGVTDHQVTRMLEKSRDLVAAIEANIIELRQKIANVFFNNLTRTQRDPFFEIFDQKKVAFFLGNSPSLPHFRSA